VSTARSIGADSINTFVISGTSSVLSVVTGVLVARWLGPLGKGLFSSLGLMQAGLAAAAGGIGAAITYLLTKRKRTARQLAGPLLLLAAATSVLAWAGLYVWGRANGFSPAWWVFFASVPASIVLSWQTYLFIGLGRVRISNLVGAARAALLVALLFFAIQMADGGLSGALVAWAISAYASAAFVVAYVMLGSHGGAARAFWADLKELAAYGTRAALGGVLGFLNYRLDSLLILWFLGAARFGIYSVAVAGSEAIYTISRSVAAASAHRIGSSSLTESADVTAKAVRTTTALVAVIAVCLATIAPLFVRVLYGQRFEAAIAPFQMLLPGVVAFASGGIFSSFLAYQLGRPMFVVYLTLAVVLLELATCSLLIPRYALLGAAAASSVTYIVASIGTTWYFCRVSGLPAREVWIVKRADLKDAWRALTSKMAFSSGGP